MKDQRTEERVIVSTDGNSGPYIIVSPENLSSVQEALRANKVPFTTDRDASSFFPVVNLSDRVDIDQIQQILDDVP